MNLQALKKDLQFVKSVLLRKPFDVLVQITNRCNMRCSFCDFWANGAKPKEEITVQEYQRISEELAQLGCFIVSIEGGEPFVRPDLVEIVQAFSRYHLPILYTNGWYVDSAKAKSLFDAGLHQVGVSIDYPDAALHDKKRGLQGTFAKAWQAVECFREAAPYKGKQVHVMTVLMKENQNLLERLLQMSSDYKVTHHTTLISTKGFRRGKNSDAPPDSPISGELLRLWKKFPHFTAFRDYLKTMDSFLMGEKMPTCRAGKQSFNIDHLGNVSPCIEKIDTVVGNVRNESMQELHQKLCNLQEVVGCQDCWTLCRGVGQSMGNRGSLNGWIDLTTRMRVH